MITGNEIFICTILGEKDEAIVHGKADKLCILKKYVNSSAVARSWQCKDTRRYFEEWSLRGGLNQPYTFTMEVWSISPGHKGSFTFMVLFDKSFGYNFHWSWVDIVMHNDQDQNFKIEKASELERSTLKESLPSLKSLGDLRFQLTAVPVENFSDVLLQVQRVNNSNGLVKFLFELHQSLLKPKPPWKFLMSDPVVQIAWSTTLENFYTRSKEMVVQNSEELLVSLPGTNLQGAVQDLNSSTEYKLTIYWLNDKTFSGYNKILLDSYIHQGHLTLMYGTYQLFSQRAANGSLLKISWLQAFVFCAKVESHLPNILSTDELTELLALMKMATFSLIDPALFIGLVKDKKKVRKLCFHLWKGLSMTTRKKKKAKKIQLVRPP